MTLVMITDHYSFPNDFSALVGDEEHSYICIISSLAVFEKEKESMVSVEEIRDRQIYSNYIWKIERQEKYNWTN